MAQQGMVLVRHEEEWRIAVYADREAVDEARNATDRRAKPPDQSEDQERFPTDSEILRWTIHGLPSPTRHNLKLPPAGVTHSHHEGNVVDRSRNCLAVST